jgi:hypothetical protein
MSTVSDEEIRMIKIDKITAPENDWGSKHPQGCFINHSSALHFVLESTLLYLIYVKKNP